MGFIVEKYWHKIALLGIIFCYFFMFSIICLPAMWTYYKVSIIDYFLATFVGLVSGGLVFNSLLLVKYHNKKEKIESGLPINFIIKIFCGKVVLYTLLLLVLELPINSFFPNLYFVLCLWSGGYFWYCVIRGYIWAKSNKGKKYSDDYSPWIGRLLLIGIILSYLVGFLHLSLN
ncbi:hypothetical protein [Ornithinibacillus sp. JPR2-1]|uniref:hypothetical protein n=1 Tax=Ornithinibacillus sp. JPR2-1 TaxID=2094019 RepID=UPI0031E15394